MTIKDPRDVQNPIIWERENVVPFKTMEETWFWFVAAQKARSEGAKIQAGVSVYPRPCEPSDIYKVLDQLHRKRVLLMDHVRVLKYYGERMYAPDCNRPKEARAYMLWNEAMNAMEPILIRKGILEKQAAPSPDWAQDALVYEAKRSYRYE